MSPVIAIACYLTLHVALDLVGSLERPNEQKMDRRFGIWNGRAPYRPGSLKTVATEFGKEQGICGSPCTGQMTQRWHQTFRFILLGKRES